MLRSACIVAGLAGCLAATSPGAHPAKPYLSPVADLAVDAATIGNRWARRPSIIIEDPRNPPKVQKDQAEALAGMLEMMSDEPIRSAADFSYGTAGEKAFDVLTLRIYVFDSTDSAEKWWITSYRFHRWEDHYRMVDGYGDEAVDSLRLNTRIVRQGNVVLSCSQTIGWDASHRALGLVCEKLRSICQEQASATQPSDSHPED